MTARLRKPASPWRRVVQAVFFVLIAAISVNHALVAVGKAIPILSSASLHAICPFGGVVSVYELLTSGTFVRKVHSASLVLAVIMIPLAILFGPVFCGWICPFGTFQEWIGWLGRKIFGRRYNRLIPAGVDRWLRYLRYLVLAWVVYMTASTARLVFEAWDPYWALFNLWSGEVAVTGYIALGVTVLASLAVERPFCKYACPYGAFLGLFNLVRVFAIRRNAKTCTSCRACDRACPMNIEVSTVTSVRNHQCISCLECTSEKACPVPNTAVHGIGTRPLAIVVPAVLVVGIGLTMVLNLWKTEGSKVPAAYTSGELAGQANPGDIRGSYTFADIAAAFEGVTVDVLATAFGVASGKAEYQVKNLEESAVEGVFEVGTDSVRLFVARWMGLPYEPEESTGMPAAAIGLLEARGRLDQESLADLRSRTVAADEPGAAQAEPTHDATTKTERSVRGSTTFGDLASWGVSEKALEDLLGGSVGAAGTTVRDHAAAQGIEFSTVRTKIQTLVDEAR